MRTPPFNPAVPLPRTSLTDMLATGAGRAETGRLYFACAAGTAVALTILVAFPAWWLLATPFICMASFAGWGMAARQTWRLDRAQRRAPQMRLSLQLARAAAAATGALAALAGFFGTIALLMQR